MQPPSVSLQEACVCPPIPGERIIQINILKASRDLIRKPVYFYSTQLYRYVPNLFDHVMPILLGKSVNFVPISCLREHIEKWCLYQMVSQLTEGCVMK